MIKSRVDEKKKKEKNAVEDETKIYLNNIMLIYERVFRMDGKNV